MSWDKARAAALKILGKDAKIPEPDKLAESLVGFEKAANEFDEWRVNLEDKVLELQNASAVGKNALGQFSNIIENSNFGLDAKNKDDAKKISQAQKVISDWLKASMKSQDENVKALGELDKHMRALAKYKPKTS